MRTQKHDRTTCKTNREDARLRCCPTGDTHLFCGIEFARLPETCRPDWKLIREATRHFGVSLHMLHGAFKLKMRGGTVQEEADVAIYTMPSWLTLASGRASWKLGSAHYTFVSVSLPSTETALELLLVSSLGLLGARR